MAVQQSVGVNIAYAPETTIGTSTGRTGGKYLRRVSSSLVVSKDSFQSNEARTDFQISDLRHGVRRAQGAIEGELSTQTWDDWLEAVMRGTWAAGASSSQTALTSVVSNTTGSLVFGGGDLITAGFRIGDTVTLTGATGTATTLNNLNFVITGITGSNRTATVYPAPPTNSTSSTFTLAVSGRKLTTGTASRSFTIEQNMPDLDISELYTGCRIGGMSLRVPPNGMASVSWDILGINGTLQTGTSAPYFTAAASAPTTGVLAGPSGYIRAGGAWRGIVTGFDLSVNLGLSAQAVIGASTVPDIFYARTQVSGNVAAYLEDASLVNAFLDETETDIVLMLEGAAAAGVQKPFLTFAMQRVKFSGISRTVQTEEGVIISLPFQALLASGTGIDSATMTVTRSNV